MHLFHHRQERGKPPLDSHLQAQMRSAHVGQTQEVAEYTCWRVARFLTQAQTGTSPEVQFA